MPAENPTGLSALMLFVLVTTLTPGPNNILLTASGANFGFRRTVPHMLGIWAGFATLILAAGLGIGAVLLADPRLHGLLKVIGAAYMLWLAWGLLRAGTVAEAGSGRPMSFVAAALFQYANPKAWLMAVGAIAAFTTPGGNYAAELALIIAAFAVFGPPCNSLWVLFGQGVARFLRDDAARRGFNCVMAGLTAAATALLFV